ncbi:MAG: hypothetical protein EP297_11645 [Gammaproteobacteria bacterium]|nr:MAG: hypothetical protein EP297_11645 [Gammaproteobacteria bacterium]
MLLLLQGLFPVQLHTYLVHDDNGRVVEVCTLEGTKTLVLDEDGNPVEHERTDNERSAAIAFSNLVAEALPGVTDPLILSSVDTTEYIPGIQKEIFSDIPPGLKPIRAPPTHSLS